MLDVKLTLTWRALSLKRAVNIFQIQSVVFSGRVWSCKASSLSQFYLQKQEKEFLSWNCYFMLSVFIARKLWNFYRCDCEKENEKFFVIKTEIMSEIKCIRKICVKR